MFALLAQGSLLGILFPILLNGELSKYTDVQQQIHGANAMTKLMRQACSCYFGSLLLAMMLTALIS